MQWVQSLIEMEVVLFCMCSWLLRMAGGGMFEMMRAFPRAK